jgi:hypothetical protein
LDLAEIDNRSEAGVLDLGAKADPDAVRTVFAADAEPPALQAPEINLGTMPDAAAASVSAAPAAVSPAPVWPMAAPPRAYRGFDADVVAQQL